MKKKLLLLRHAKSSWDDANLSDYERPLNNRGKQNASTMGNFLKKENLVPDLIISSTAKRANKTANIIAKKSGYNKKILVLGDMLELGENEIEYHKEIGRFIDPSKIDFLITFGQLSRFLANEAKRNLGAERIIVVTDKEEIVTILNSVTNIKDAILLHIAKSLQT